MAAREDNIAGVANPDAILAGKGEILAASGPGVAVRVPAGPDGHAVVYDSTTESGLGSLPIDPTHVNSFNATNAFLFNLGM